MKRLNLSKYRILTLAGGVIIITAAFFIGTGVGSYCTLCPLGLLQIAAASGSLPTGMLFGTLSGLIAVLVLGRFFCGWFCPTTLIKKVFGSNGKKYQPSEKANKYIKRLPVLIAAGSVAVSFLAGFPVFCLICPIGIFFGFIFAVMKMLFVLEPSWNLIIFPAILTAEILIFKKWCSYICPVSALFSLVSKIPFVRFRPVLNSQTCISHSGGLCSSCIRSCPEGINITENDEDMNTKCTSCMECIDNCPTHSLSYARNKTNNNQEDL